MKRAFIIPVLALLLVTVACVFGGSTATQAPTDSPKVELVATEKIENVVATEAVETQPTQAQSNTPSEASTDAPTEKPVASAPTALPTPEPTLEPTEAPTEEVVEESPYFESDFDDLEGFQHFVSAGDKTKVYAEGVTGDRLQFKLPKSETYAYVEEINHFPADVYVEAKVETVKGDQNGIAVICRGSIDGWYELRVATIGPYAGSYNLYRYDPTLRERKQNPYVNLLAPSERVFTPDIKAGFKTNIIGLACVGNELHTYINGREQIIEGKKLITDDELYDGTVGVGAMSFSKGTVQVEFDYLVAQEP